MVSSAHVTMVTLVMVSLAPTLTSVPPTHVIPMPHVLTLTVVSLVLVTLATPATDSAALMLMSALLAHAMPMPAATIPKDCGDRLSL